MRYIPFANSHDNSARDGSAAQSVEPFDESLLAAEIARALERRRERAPPAAKGERWLGDEADAALVDASVALPGNDHHSGTPLPVRREPAAAAPASGGDAPVVEPSTLAWVKTAQRQRRNARLRGVAGWALSLVVSLIVIAASGLAVMSWSGALGALRQQQPGAASSASTGRQAEADTQRAVPPLLRTQTLR